MKRPFTLIAAFIFAVIAVIHLLRVAYGWAITFVGANVPVWGSVVAMTICAVLAAGLWWESRR